MARRKQEGNRFFRLDVDFFSDKKVKILKARYGADGVTLYLYILCEIYKAGYYLKIDEDFEFIVSDDLSMDSNKVKQVLNFLLERSLFDNTLFQSDNSSRELEVIIETAEGKYQKDYVYLNDYTMYVVEDISGSDVDKYHYEINFLPQFGFKVTHND